LIVRFLKKAITFHLFPLKLLQSAGKSILLNGFLGDMYNEVSMQRTIPNVRKKCNQKRKEEYRTGPSTAGEPLEISSKIHATICDNDGKHHSTTKIVETSFEVTLHEFFSWVNY
jgi:GTPase SAR1 family protein